MAFVRKRGTAWYVRFADETGEQVERRTKARTKTEAREIAEELERRADRVRLGLETAVIEISVEQLYTKHFAPIRQGRGGFSAMDNRFRKHILPVLGHHLVHQIRPFHVEELLAAKEREGYSDSTREHIRVELSALFTFAIERYKAFRGENPARAVPKVVIQETPPKYLDRNQVADLISHVSDRWRGLFAVAVYTGLRPGELRRLRVRDVDLEARRISVYRTKTGKLRYVPVVDELVPYLKLELGRVRSEWLFPRHDGTQLTKDCPLPELLRAALKRAGHVQGYDHRCTSRGFKGKRGGCGFHERRADSAPSNCPRCERPLHVVAIPLDISTKDLRSTFGTHAAEATGDLRIVQQVLGHSSIAVTERRYAAARERHVLEQANKVSFQTGARQLPATETEKDRNEPNGAEVVRLR